MVGLCLFLMEHVVLKANDLSRKMESYQTKRLYTVSFNNQRKKNMCRVVDPLNLLNVKQFLAATLRKADFVLTLLLINLFVFNGFSFNNSSQSFLNWTRTRTFFN